MSRPCRNHAGPARDLTALAEHLDAIAEEAGWGAPPLIIGLTDDGPDEAEGPAPLAGGGGVEGVVGGLVGFVAPPDWRAVAVVVHGRSLPWPGTDGDPRPLRLVHVVDRAGRSASVVRIAGDEPGPQTLEGPSEGRLVDACRRVLGLATPPPPPDSTGLWAVLWLDRLLADAAAGRDLSPLAARRRHPAIELFVDHDPGWADQAAEALSRLGRSMGDARPWPELHRAAAEGEWQVPGLDGAAAAWMDTGMFARWVLAEFPTVAELRGELERLVPEAVVAAVDEHLAAWDLPDGAVA